MLLPTRPLQEAPPVITLTDTAATKVKDLIEAEGEPNLALRVAVRPGGCSGFSYEMFFDTDVADDDNLVDYSGVRVVVDSSSAELLKGATLDYKDGLQGAGFAIENPNAQRSCGCGKSFS
jgi:iron-sulfur cluster assembly protein/iron-sulfur cluster insertion protein